MGVSAGFGGAEAAAGADDIARLVQVDDLVRPFGGLRRRNRGLGLGRGRGGEAAKGRV